MQFRSMSHILLKRNDVRWNKRYISSYGEFGIQFRTVHERYSTWTECDSLNDIFQFDISALNLAKSTCNDFLAYKEQNYFLKLYQRSTSWYRNVVQWVTFCPREMPFVKGYIPCWMRTQFHTRSYYTLTSFHLNKIWFIEWSFLTLEH